ncbi:MAG: hypothetical protein M1831_001086 [Alyxoria varia]|nr:MAG: hypothetical protein M1831_001086 [Alyxoria varia]
MGEVDEYQTYRLGDFTLQSGVVLQSAFIAYKTLGSPDLPAVIYPTWYSGLISDNLWLVNTPESTISPSNHFSIIPALLGNSQSSSPSNTPERRPWPTVTFYDNVRAQHRLVTEKLGITHARLVMGWSMGAAQSFQWATQFPEFMDYVVPFCGSARTSLHNRVFLEGVKNSLLAARGHSGKGVCEMGAGPSKASSLPTEQELEKLRLNDTHNPWTPQERTVGLKALARVYAGWGFSQAFYRERLYEKAPTLGFSSLEDFMVGFWETWALSKDPENMLAMLDTWACGDVSLQGEYGGDFGKAMRGVRAKTLVLPSRTDLYFPPEDSEIEVESMTPGVGELDVFPSIWGHWAGGPGQSTEDVKWLNERLKDFLTEQ